MARWMGFGMPGQGVQKFQEYQEYQEFCAEDAMLVSELEAHVS